MKKIMSMLIVILLTVSLTGGSLAADDAAKIDTTYEIVVPISYNRIDGYSAAHGLFVTQTDSGSLDLLYSMDGELLLSAQDIQLVGDWIIVKQNDLYALLNCELEEVIAFQDAPIFLVDDSMALLVTPERYVPPGNYHGKRTLVDLQAGETLQTYSPGVECDFILLPDGTTVSPTAVHQSYRTGSGTVSLKLSMSETETIYPIYSARDRLITSVYSSSQPTLFTNGYFYTEDRTGVVYSDEAGICVLYNADGEVVIPGGIFGQFLDLCDDVRCLIVEKDGQYGVIRLPEYTPQPDVWAAAEVAEAVAAGYVDEDIRWWWRDNCTRQEFCLILMRAIGTVETETTGSFSDCDHTDVLSAASLGIVTGYDDGTFRPDAYITRQEAAVMLARAAAYLGKTPVGNMTTFEDASAIGAWAMDAIATVSSLIDSDGNAVMGGVGNGNFSPNGGYTVEQAAVTVLRLMKCP